MADRKLVVLALVVLGLGVLGLGGAAYLGVRLARSPGEPADRRASSREDDPAPSAATDPLRAAVESLRTRDRTTRPKAIAFLKTQGESGLRALLDALDSEKEPGVSPLADALASWGNLALPALLEALADAKEDRRICAVIGIRKIVQEPWSHLEFVDDTVKARGPDLEIAVPPLILALDDPSARVRVEAAVTLGKMGTRAAPATDALRRSLEEGALALRVGSAVALGKIGPAARSAVPALAGALEDSQVELREVSAIALGRIGPEAAPAIEALARALREDVSGEVRRWAAAALGKVGPEATRALDALIAALEDPYLEVRYMAANSIGHLEDDAIPAVPSLIEALGDDEPRVRRRVAMALGAIGPEAHEAVTALMHLLDTGDAAHEEAAWALGRIGKTALAPLLRSLAPGNDDTLRRSGSLALKAVAREAPDAALPGILPHLGDADENVRRNLMEAVVLVGNEAVPHLEQALAGDLDEEDREGMRDALAEIRRRARTE